MSTVTDELLLRIAVLGGAVAAEEVALFEERIGSAELAVGRASKRFSLFRSTLGLLGASFAGMGIIDAVRQFSSFQRQMTMLHTQTGATVSELHHATSAVLGMAASVGTGPNSLAQALYHIESTQVRGQRAYNELRIAAEGAKVGNANLVDVTNALNAVLVGKLIPATGGFRAAMGQLNATVGSGDMYMQDLASAYSTGILKSLQSVGLKLIDINSAMAVLGDNNLRGTQAANRLRMGLLQVVKPTNAAAKEMHAYGMSTFQLAQDYYKPNGLYVMLQDLHKHLDKLSKVKQNDVLMTLFGRGRMSAGVLTLYTEMGRLQQKYTAIDQGAKGFQASWEATKHTLAFAIDQLKTLGEVLMIRVGGGLNATVGWVMTKFIPALQHGKVCAYELTMVLVGLTLALVGPKGIRLAVELVRLSMLALERIPLVAALSLISLAVIELIAHWDKVNKVLYSVKTHFLSFFSTVKSEAAKFVNEVNKILGPLSPFGTYHKPRPGLHDPTRYSYNPLHPYGNEAHSLNTREVLLPGVGPVNISPKVLLPGGTRIADTKYGAIYVPTPQGAKKLEQELHIHINIDGKQVAQAVVKQGAMATARRGAGGPTISDAGIG